MDPDSDSKLSFWSAGAWGATLGFMLFLECLLVGGFEPGRTLFLMLGIGALLGIEWNELHFLERHGVTGFFARWAIAGASVGVTVFGIGRAGEGWPWWGLFGGLGLGAVLGSAAGLEWGRLLGDPPWASNEIAPPRDPALLQIDRGGSTKPATGRKTESLERASSEPDSA
jgi:hypothetical protein